MGEWRETKVVLTFLSLCAEETPDETPDEFEFEFELRRIFNLLFFLFSNLNKEIIFLDAMSYNIQQCYHRKKLSYCCNSQL
jgi:hypothetical protein